jgi:hypothetical protein
VAWHVARHADCPVTIVGLAEQASTGPSTGRVVVGVDRVGDPRVPLGFAFQAATRRSVGVTVLSAGLPRVPSRRTVPVDHMDGAPWGDDLTLEESIQGFQVDFPAVDVHVQLVTTPLTAALVAESAAALVVLSAHGHRHRGGPLSDAAIRAALRTVRSPVAVLRTPSAGRRTGSQRSSFPRNAW